MFRSLLQPRRPWRPLLLALAYPAVATGQDPHQQDAPPPAPEPPLAGANDASAPGEEDSGIAPPRLTSRVEPVYPLEANEALTVHVELIIVVKADGQVGEVSIAESGGPAVDRAATDAVRKWTFEPARRDGRPLASRIRVALDLSPQQPQAVGSGEETAPEDQAEPADKPADEPPAAPASADAAPSPQRVPEGQDSHLSVTIHGDRPLRTERRTAGDYFLHRELLEAAPHLEGVDRLNSVPGLTLSRPEGSALAHEYNLRGFDSEHGQDIEFNVAGLPINLPSQVHGHGYADLGFLVGDVVDEISVKEGVSDPAQGDFAVAGSVNIGLGVDAEHRGITARSTLGSFGSFQQTLLWAPKESERESFGAAQFSTTDGYGQNRAAKSGSVILQHRFGRGALRYRAVGFAHAAQGQSAGAISTSDIQSGLLCYHCTYDDPAAKAQITQAQRVMAGIFADYRGAQHATSTVGFWASRDWFTTRFDMTGYAESQGDPTAPPGASDLTEQRNVQDSFGLTGRYRSEALSPFSFAHGTWEVGADARMDAITQSQSRLTANDLTAWDQSIQAGVQSLTASLWMDLDIQLGSKVNVRAGVRGALLNMTVEDGLADQAESPSLPASGSGGVQRLANGAFVGPRASLEYRVARTMSLMTSYGVGYRSAQALTIGTSGEAPFTTTTALDLGLRYRPSDLLTLSAVGFLTHVDNDLLFEAHEGMLEQVGPTRRLGTTLQLTTSPTDWLLGSLSVTYVSATLVGLPPGLSAEDEAAQLAEVGQPLPYVPPLVMQAAASAKRTLVDEWGAHPLVGTLSLGFTYRSPRPLGDGQWGKTWTLLDASAAATWGPLDAKLAAYNVLNLDYANQEYMLESNWTPGASGAGASVRHIVAGPPLSIMATLGLTL